MTKTELLKKVEDDLEWYKVQVIKHIADKTDSQISYCNGAIYSLTTAKILINQLDTEL